MHLTAGTELQNGKYRIVRVLGQGGFGITYLAENILLERKVAIKEFFPKEFCDRDNTSRLTIGTEYNRETVKKLKERFLKEARNIARLDHPGIVKIHDIFEDNGTAYYVMDYIDGENMQSIVREKGPLSEEKAVKYVCRVGEALEYIHSLNMTHFDVKPANIVVRKSDDMPILIDFGLSKQYDARGSATSSMMQAISPGYSPIELYNASNIIEFSPKTDVYSLGATLYNILTGKTPPHYSEILEEGGLPITPRMSPAIRSAIEHAMAVTKNKRPESIQYFLNEISPKKIDARNEKSDLEEDQIPERSADEYLFKINEPVYEESDERQLEFTSASEDNKDQSSDQTVLIDLPAPPERPEDGLSESSTGEDITTGFYRGHDDESENNPNLSKIIITCIILLIIFLIIVVPKGCNSNAPENFNNNQSQTYDTILPDYDLNNGDTEVIETYEPATAEDYYTSAIDVEKNPIAEHYANPKESPIKEEKLTQSNAKRQSPQVSLYSIIDAFATKCKDGFVPWNCLDGLKLDYDQNNPYYNNNGFESTYYATILNNKNVSINGDWAVTLQGPRAGANYLYFQNLNRITNCMKIAEELGNASFGTPVNTINQGYFYIRVYKVRGLLFATICVYESNHSDVYAVLGNSYFINNLLESLK